MKNPKYIAIAAITLDGKIAKHSKHFSSWTSKEDKQFLHAILDACDVIIVGNSTYQMAKKPFTKLFFY
jgi:riboflavin biosynthesis pyrimidine reductase